MSFLNMLPGDLRRAKRRTRVNRSEIGEFDQSAWHTAGENHQIVFTSYQKPDDSVTFEAEGEIIDTCYKFTDVPLVCHLDVANRDNFDEDRIHKVASGCKDCDGVGKTILSDKLETGVQFNCPAQETSPRFCRRRRCSVDNFFSEKDFDLNRNLSQEFDSGYVPSWLCADDDKENDMDLSSSKSFELLTTKHSKSLTDLRHVGSVQRKPKARSEDIDKNKHEKIEKEYFRLKKRLNLNSDGSLKNHDTFNTAQDHTRANLSDTAIPNYKELLESDELGINHFRKHVHNVKVTSKKFRRAQKSNDQSTVKTRGAPKRRQFSFKPLYEHLQSEDSSEFHNSL